MRGRRREEEKEKERTTYVCVEMLLGAIVGAIALARITVDVVIVKTPL